jgi:hypothetical protein
MNNYKVLIGIIALFYPVYLYSQEITIHGKVQNTEEIPIDFYIVDVFDFTNDTVFIAQEMFSDSLFQIKVDVKNKLLLKISSYGYEPVMKEFVYTGNNNPDIGTIILNVKDLLLNEVVITANKPFLKMKGSKLVVSVENSSLQDMGDANDVLSRVPGVRKINDEFDIFGKGSPAIYIDGKLMQNKEELHILKSENIAEIIVDRNPSALYDANIRSVILIKTKKKMQDMLGIQIGNVSTFKRKYSNSSSSYIDWKKGIVAASLSYHYGIGESLIKESSYRSVYNDNYIFYSNLDYTTKYKSHGHTLGGKLGIDMNEKSHIGFQYTGSFYPKNEDLYDKTQYIEEKNLKYNRLITQRAEDDSNMQSVSANYSYSQNQNTTFTLIIDYVFKEEKKNTLINEQNLESGTFQNTKLLSNNKYNVYTATLNYKFKIFNAFETVVGTRYASIGNDSKNRFLESIVNDNSENNLTDKVWAGFFQTQKEWNKFNLNAGIRYEYDNMQIAFLPDSMTKRHFSDFLPNLTMEYKINDNMALDLNYSKKIVRPSFYNLNSTIFYEDSLSYISGNKQIAPTDINNFSLNVSFWENLSFGCGYTRIKNQIVQTSISDKDIANKVWMIPVNIDKTELFDLSLAYYLSHKKWSMNCMAMTEIPQLKIPYLDQTIKITKPIWAFSFNNELAISDNLQLYENFTFNSSGYSDLTYRHSTNNLTIGFVWKFFNGKLAVKIEGTDLLDGSNWNNWDERYFNIRSGCRGSYDSRGVQVRLSYKLNAIKSNVVIQKGNTDILDRMY